MRIVLASRNAGKLRELEALFAPLNLTLESQDDHGVPSPAEDGLTFIENALIKARAVAGATGLAAVADDSGLVVPVLGGAPGIYSARYAGHHGDDAGNNAKLLAELDGISDRRAFFYCAIVLLRHAEDPTPVVATAAWHGAIAASPSGSGGFGYDPLFVPEGERVTAAQMAPAAKRAQSHRGQAVATLVAELRRLRLADA